MTGYSLAPDRIEAVVKLLEGAHGEGRNVLFEHEVYRILTSCLGLETPAYRFLPEGTEVSREQVFGLLGNGVVVKVVSRDILHKSRVGGVAHLPHNTARVAHVIRHMTEEVPRHAEFATRPRIDGFLLCEGVDYSTALGNEFLISLRENADFGSVVTVGKGGDDAELFAALGAPPEIGITPLDMSACRKLAAASAPGRKLVRDGREDHLDRIAGVAHRFALLGAALSPLETPDTRFVLEDFEINPFVFDAKGRLLALDGLVRFRARDAGEAAPVIVPDRRNVDALFEPTGVAVAGVSATDPRKMGNVVAGLLHALGRDDLHLVNPKGGTLRLGEKDYPIHPSVDAIEDPVDLSIVLAPASATPAIAEGAFAKGVKALVLIPGGFSEVSGDRSIEERLLTGARAAGTRILGPNCLGVFYAPEEGPGINNIFVSPDKLDLTPPEGRSRTVALVNQSGALGVTILDKLHSALCPRVVVSYGNQLDLDPGDLVAHLGRDEKIRVIGVYVEGFRAGGGRKFLNAVKDLDKPVILYKAGRTEAGSRAAASHTASMAGDYAVAKAAFAQAGIVHVESIQDHHDLVKTFALLDGKKVRGNRLAGMVNAGFNSTYAADSLGGLTLATLSEGTREALAGILPPFVSVASMLDLTPMANDALYGACLEKLLADDGVDAVVVSMLPYTPMLKTTAKELARHEDNVADRVVRLAGASDKPVVFCNNAGSTYDALSERLEAGGVPTFRTIDRAVRCLDRFMAWWRK